jgi:MoaA/NifB/PqqE/SkfB family radical SAM enzyme
MTPNHPITQRPDMMFYGKLAQRKLGYVAGQLELTSLCHQRCVACDSWRQHKKGNINNTLPLQTIKNLAQRPDMMFYGKLAQRKLGYVAGQLELTSLCHQRCVACDSWRQHKKGNINNTLPLQTIKNLAHQLNQTPTFEHLTLTGGEPQDWRDPIDPSITFEDLLTWLSITKKFSLQVNTNFCKPVNVSLWRNALNRVRVSLDAVTPETYKLCRGDTQDPEHILARIEELNHGGLATMTCVSEYNIHEVPDIITRLNRMNNPPRKAMFLAVLDFGHTDPNFWEQYNALREIPSPRVPTSFSEDVSWVREFVCSPQARDIPCHSGSITFHVKCNGDVYPCCLVGGEAIKTRTEMRIGNIHNKTLAQIQKEYKPGCHYRSPDSPCRAVCQWKQLNLNRVAHEASKTFLTMP